MNIDRRQARCLPGHEPAERRDPGPGLAPELRQQQVRQGISTSEYRKLLRDPDKPMLNVAINEQYPPGSTYKLVTGAGALADGKISRAPGSRPSLSSRSANGSTGSGTGRAGAHSTSSVASATPATPSSTARRPAQHRSLGLLGAPVRLRQADRHRSARRGHRASCPPTSGSAARSTRATSPESCTRRASARATTRARRIQVLNAYAALANGGTLYKPQLVRKILDSEGNVIERVQPEVIRELDIDKIVLRTMRGGIARVDHRHTYNLVDLPIVVAGKSGTAEFGIATSRAGCPSATGSWPSCPRRRARRDPSPTASPRSAAKTPSWSCWPTSTTPDQGQRGHRGGEVLPAAALRSQDRPAPAVGLERDNFYNSNS